MLSNHVEPIVFIVGGIGITLVLPMVKDLERRNFSVQALLLYSTRTVEDAGYLAELEKIDHPHFRLIHVTTRSQGRIDLECINRHIQAPASCQYYIVGSGGFLRSIEEHLNSAGVEPSSITIDDFG